MYPNEIIKYFSKEQQDVLLKMLNKKSVLDLKIEEDLTKMISSFSGFFSKTKSYKEILIQVCQKKELNFASQNSISELEEIIVVNYFNFVIDNLSPEEKEKFNNELEKYAQENKIDKAQLNSFRALGTLGIANLSGFSLYIMASTLFGGLGLPFAFFTGMSSVLSFVTGPVGWAIGIGYAAYSFRNDDYNSATEKIKNSIKSVKTIFTGNVSLCETVISFIFLNRKLVIEECNSKTIILEKKVEIEKTNLNSIKSDRNILEDKINTLKNELLNKNQTIQDKKEEINDLTSKIIQNNIIVSVCGIK